MPKQRIARLEFMYVASEYPDILLEREIVGAAYFEHAGGRQDKVVPRIKDIAVLRVR